MAPRIGQWDAASISPPDEQMCDEVDFSWKGNGHTMHQDHIRDAAADAVSARQAIAAGRRRCASAVTTAQDLIDNARAAERAEQDAARSALAASIRRLLAEDLSVKEIANICRISPAHVRAMATAS